MLDGSAAMTPDEFRDWRARLKLTQAEAGRLLGLSVRGDGTTCDAIRHYERGTRQVSDTVALLCRYVEVFGPPPDAERQALAKGLAEA